MSLTQGTVVDRYRVHGLIGTGAMGEVFLAIDEGLGRWVALKILLDTHRDNPELRARFIREARAVARISHPNVVQVFATGDLDGLPYFAMEYVQGRDLGSLVRSDGPLESYAAAGVILDAARGLQAAAQAGLIHRDVKPSNLVRLDSGPVKVTDFGLAKPVLRSEDPGLTALGVVVGTPDYIAPEQARGEDIDSRVDVYALGCTLFFVLTGKPPFRRGTDEDDKYMKVVARHLREPAPDARRHALGVDTDLADLALDMMAKLPDERPSYDDVIARLEQVRARLYTGKPRASTSQPKQPRATTRPLDPEATPPPKFDDLDDLDDTRAKGRGRWLWLLTGGCAAVLGAGIAVTVFGSPPAPIIASPRDAGPAVAAADAAPRPRDAGGALTPAGMVGVTDDDGKLVFFVDRNAVSQRAYAEMTKAKVAAADADRPVVGVSFKDARRYAAFRGKRLLTDDEWQAALDTLGFVPAGMEVWEWVDDGGEDTGDQSARRVNEGVGKRKPAGDKQTTFRLAQDPKSP